MGSGGNNPHPSHSCSSDSGHGNSDTETVIISLLQVSQEVVHGWCKEKDMPYFEVSAKNDINVVQAFEVLASRALLRVSDVVVELVRTALSRVLRIFQRRKYGHS